MPKPRQSEIIQGVWSLHDKHERWDALEEIASRISRKAFYRLFVEVWSNSESNDMHIERIDRMVADYDISAYTVMPTLEAVERKFYHALPELITVYRGTTLENPYGDYSWTTDTDKAYWFAKRCFDGTPALASGLARKSDIWFSYNGRNEFEIAVHHDKLLDRQLRQCGAYQTNESYKFYALIQAGGADNPEMRRLTLLSRIAYGLANDWSHERIKQQIYAKAVEGERLGFVTMPRRERDTLDHLDWVEMFELAETQAVALRKTLQTPTFQL